MRIHSYEEFDPKTSPVCFLLKYMQLSYIYIAGGFAMTKKGRRSNSACPDDW